MPATSRKDPWWFAETFRREKISPEDVQSACDAGADHLQLCITVLDAISSKSCEDYRLCSFIAARFEKSKTKAK